MSIPNYGELAFGMARHVSQQARWNGSACEWMVSRADSSNAKPTQVFRDPCGGGIYQGSAGIALFLSEVFGVTGDRDVQRHAEGALRDAVTKTSRIPGTFMSFHAGRVGVVYALIRHAMLANSDEFAALAEEMFAPVEGHENGDVAFDVIGGPAGAIPALLLMAEWLGNARYRDCAVRLGDQLIATAHQETLGWSWPMAAGATARNLTGLAHGAAGAGHALLELYHVTGSARFGFAAHQAFAYESTAFDTPRRNWLDFRNMTLLEMRREPDQFKFVQAILQRDDALPVYTSKAMSAWCHGAPGIGLTRLSAYQRTGRSSYLAESRVALENTLLSLREPGNVSLCHGAFGNCETLVMGTDILAEPQWKEAVHTHVVDWADRITRTNGHWPSGVLQAAQDPSLLLGESGVGHFWLRMHSPSIPSVLLPSVARVDRPANLKNESGRGIVVASFPPVDGAEIDMLRRRYNLVHFPRVMRVLEWHAARGLVSKPLPALTQDELSLGVLRDVLDMYLTEFDHPEISRIVADARILDEAMLETKVRCPDLSALEFEAVLSANYDEQSPDESMIQLAPHVTIVQCEHDWERWLNSWPAESLPETEPQPIEYAVAISRSAPKVVRLTPFASCVLSESASWLPFVEILDRVNHATDGSVDPVVLRARVAQQIKMACDVGLLYVRDAQNLVVAQGAA